MTKTRDHRSWQEEPDAVLDAALSRLGHLSPSPGLGDAVMERLRIEWSARPITRRKQAKTQPNRRRLGWILAGGYAASSTISLVLLAAMWDRAIQYAAITEQAARISTFIAWDNLVLNAAALYSAAATDISFISQILPAVAIGATAMWLATMVSSIGMYRISKHYRVGRKRLHAIR